MIGRTLAHYRIDGKLGQGGMGEVYRAHDETLGRDVAVKVLPVELASDPERLARFQREARTLAALNHPNVVTIFEVGAAGGVDFLAMELVAGRTLTDVIPRGGLPPAELMAIAVPLADALAAAHERGVVHRDLKASNVMVSPNGRVKVLDFGLAKLEAASSPEAATATEDSLTREGGPVGTVPYMAPEQVQGKGCDRRSDIFSLGVVLHEMATGHRPFAGESFAEVASAILRDPAPEVDRLRPDLPRDLGRVIRRCLEKDPERRFQSAKDVRNELEDVAGELETEASRPGAEPAPPPSPGPRRRRLALGAGAVMVVAALALVGVRMLGTHGPSSGAPAAGRIRSLAVLPFANLSNEPDQEYFVQGMHEELITDLSKVTALRVISRTSAMRYRGTDKSIPEIARELGVDALVEGSVLRAGDQVRITAQLIDGTSDRHLWVSSYDRDLGDVLGLLSDVARTITREIAVTVTPEQQRRLASRRTVDPAVHDLYLRARFHLHRLGYEHLVLARQGFEELVTRAPDYAPGRTGLGATSFLLGFFGYEPFVDVLPRAEAMVRSALELDPELAEAHTAMGLIQLYGHWDWEEARHSFERAIDVGGNDAMARHGLADYFLAMGDTEESLRQVRMAVESDPLAISTLTFLVGHLMFAQHFDEAVSEADRALDLYPGRPGVRFLRARCLWLRGSYQDALAAFQELWGAGRELDAMRAGYERGGPAAAMAALADLVAAAPRADPLVAATYYAVAGDADQAFAWLDRAFAAHVPQLPHVVGDPCFDPVRSDPRYGELLHRMGLSG